MSIERYPMSIDSTPGMRVTICADRRQMGVAAAMAAARLIDELLKARPVVNMIFAAAPSQNEFTWTNISGWTSMPRSPSPGI